MLTKQGKLTKDIIRETLDWLLLNNPAYAQSYHHVMGTLSRVENAVQSAMDRLRAELYEAKAELEDIRDRAPKLPAD